MSEFSPRSMLIRALKTYDASRPRSQQEEVGPSAIYGCERQVYHQLKGTRITNFDTDVLAALLGTFIHTGIEKALETEDPFGDNFLKEVAVAFNGLPGHVDLFVKNMAIVVDWKTTTKAKLKGDSFPTDQYIYQVHVYGYLLKQAGHDVKKVAMVAVPRDGRMDQIAEYIADYDEEIALRGIAWLDRIKKIVADGGKAPEPSKSKTFCQFYCPFYDPTAKVGCPSMGGR